MFLRPSNPSSSNGKSRVVKTPSSSNEKSRVVKTPTQVLAAPESTSSLFSGKCTEFGVASLNAKRWTVLLIALFCVVKAGNVVLRPERRDGRLRNPLVSSTFSYHNVSFNECDFSKEIDPCDEQFWISELAKGDELLSELTPEQVGIVHITFTVNGTKDRKANDRLEGTHDRATEMQYSVACLKKVLPEVKYAEVPLGDFSSYQEGLVEQHSWLAREPTFPATFVIDTDVYANPYSDMTTLSLSRALKNVDLAFVYNPNRGRGPPGEIHLQSGGLQAGLIGQRNNKRTKLFQSCVAHTLRTTEGSIRQQNAINKVLESALGQFVRIRWLPPEFHCWSPGLQNISEFVVSNGPRVQEDPCYFMHSHNLAIKGGLDGVC
ncbi:hypothetical protein ACA910_012968 [Epithemia clementina (nom. ined.)]